MERSAREVCGAAGGPTLREISRCARTILKLLEDVGTELAKIPVEAEHMIARVVSNLGLPPEFALAGRAITRAAKSLMEADVAGMPAGARTPGSVAAVAVWLALNLHGGAPSTRADLARVSSFSESYINALAKARDPAGGRITKRKQTIRNPD